MGAVIILIPLALLKSILGVKEEVEITGVNYNSMSKTLNIRVEHSNLPAVWDIAEPCVTVPVEDNMPVDYLWWLLRERNGNSCLHNFIR